ncbi:hypothetical protein LJC30_04615 [Odoribacter sp. OttesenSCG-928-L07]|nr:hypothetical protein [Odoribacter sp. OttesenSCG-928-L07]MDL2239087.1 hypothetical protein [Bacteroidales bacterium OttesenSCG-928-L14]MDL2240000.1 hypothetical protein [Bacteroidales bacterium OttesenSCG-928-K22]
MKKIFLPTTAILLSIILFSACGGKGSNTDGNNSSKKIGKNEYLGELPSLIHQYKTTDSTLKADETAKYLKLGSKITKEQAMEIVSEFETKKKDNKQKFDDGVAKAKETLVGKDIPTEVKVSNYEIPELKISNVNPYSVQTKGNLTIKEDTPTITYFGEHRLELYYACFDKNNKSLKKNKMTITVKNRQNSTILSGEQYDFDLNISLDIDGALKWNNFAKVVFMSKEEYETLPK